MKAQIITFALIAVTLMSCNNSEKKNTETTEDSKTEMNQGNDVNQDNEITEKYWKLKTLEGQDVTMADNQEREQFFTLKTNENRIAGFAGCNAITGEYKLEEGNRIRFSNVGTTMKACPDVDVNESEFLEVFNLADNYTIKDDVLSLNVGRRAPLAVFEAVYMD